MPTRYADRIVMSEGPSAELAKAAARNNGVYIWPGLKLNLEVNLARHRVARCAVCNLRRVLYSLAIVGMGESPRMCAPCAGIRP